MSSSKSEEIEREKGNINKIFDRIDGILKKMLMLTLFVEFSFFIGAVYTQATSRLLEQVFPALLNNNVIWPMQFVFIGFVMYLMLEHNVQQYYIFLRWMDELKLFCCCWCFRSLLDGLKDQQIMLHILERNDKGNHVVDPESPREMSEMTVQTKTIHTVPKSPTVRYEDPSVSIESVHL